VGARPAGVVDPVVAGVHLGVAGKGVGGSGIDLQFQAVDAFLDLVEALAHRGPLVLGLDDLQWADPSSLLTLGALARRLTDSPVALIASLRPLPRSGELERALEALDAAGACHLALGQLGQEAVTELVAEAVAAEPGPRLMAEAAAAGGNPLFVTELVAALLHEGAIQVADGRAEVAEMTLPPNLRLTILRRLSFLPDDTLEALRPAAVLGSSFSLTELSATTGRSVLELSSVLAEALRARVLEDDGERLRFRHDLIHEAIYEDLPASVRLGLHREAGRRLAGAGAEAVAVVEHLARGATPGDAEAIAWLTRAANQAAPRSPAVAAELLERAIGLADPADPGRDRLLVDRAGALMWSGRLPEAEAALRSLLDREHDPSVEGQARILLSRTLGTQGRMRDTLRELERVTVPDARRRAARRRGIGGGHGPPAAGRPGRRGGSGRAGEQCGAPTTAPSGEGTRRWRTWPGGTSSWRWTGSRRPGPRSRPAGGSARSSASAGGFRCTRPSSGWSASWPVSGTTPWPSSRRRWP
jgi:Tetratricopeptide repeat